MKRSDIIQNPEILSINCQEDYFRYTDHAADIHRRLRSVSKNALVALVGNDGVGKTFLVPDDGVNQYTKQPCRHPLALL